MPQMRFNVRWPDGRRMSCYSPSLIIKEYFQVGESYTVPEFLARSGESLTIASERVKAKFGFYCTSASDQLEAITSEAERFSGNAEARVIVEGFEE